jgi:peptidoglycan/xylan/chitin deacetylase (PgdA/CDA1 family)
MPVLPRFGDGQSTRAVGVIMVHDVLDDSCAAELATSTSVPFRSFESNVLGLARNFSFIGLDEAVSMLTGAAAWRKNCLVLTFDDSLKCLAHVVAPKLQEWGIPATFYLSSGAIESQEPYWWHRLDFVISHGRGVRAKLALANSQVVELELQPGAPGTRELARTLRQSSAADCEYAVAQLEARSGLSLREHLKGKALGQVMDWEDVHALVRCGMSLGCHSHSHPNLNLVPAPQLDRELSQARRILAAKGGADCSHFCYPYGEHSELVCAAVKAAGFRSAVTTQRPGWNEPGADLFRLKRFHMHEEPYCLPCTLSGLGQFLTRVRNSVSGTAC